MRKAETLPRSTNSVVYLQQGKRTHETVTTCQERHTHTVGRGEGGETERESLVAEVGEARPASYLG